MKGMLDYAFQKVPYYRNVFVELGITPDDLKTKADLLKIPVLTRELIREYEEQLKAEGINPSRVRKNSTSGSTGNNLRFYSDTGVMVRPALQKRCYDWMGVDYFDKKMNIWGATWDLKKSKQIISSIKKFIKSTLVVSGYKLSDENLMSYYQFMKKHRPVLLISYPSIFYEMAILFKNKDFQYFPKALQTGGEKLFPYQRELVEAVFQTSIFDFYGARDMPMIAQECEQHNGMHIMAENVLVEVLDEFGQPLEEGEGDLVITDLHNKVMPFIRYRIGDRAVITQKQCSCGRGLPLLKEIIGRSFEVIEFPNGNRVGGTFWTILLKTQPGIKNLQVIQKALYHIQINYVLENKNVTIDFNKFLEKIHEYSGIELRVIFNEVSRIPLTKGGKFRFVIKESENE